MIGQLIDDKYEVTGELGAGAMGAVYRARNVATGRMVAVKVIQNVLGKDPSLVARFQREARAAGAIQSSHIAQVLDAGQDRTTEAPYLVMELLEGEDLDTLLHRLGTLRCDLALRIIAQALAGLERAHAAGVVHRDIKPANLYIARGDAGQRVVKLVDFGIAKVKDDFAASNHALTQTSTLLGSPLYMSPEQAKASKKVDARADLWSLGIVLYQLLTGHAPHAHAESLTELLLAICTETAKPVQQSAPWVPGEVAEIVERALRLDPNKRFGDAAQMRDAIAKVTPDWNILSDDMLTPLTREERAFIAQPAPSLEAMAASTGPAAGAARSSSSSGSQPGNSALAFGGATQLEPLAHISASQQSAPALAASANPTAEESRSGGGGARRSRVAMVAAGGAIVLATAFFGVRSFRPNETAPSGLVEEPVVATSGSVAVEPAADTPAVPSSIATPSEAPSAAPADPAVQAPPAASARGTAHVKTTSHAPAASVAHATTSTASPPASTAAAVRPATPPHKPAASATSPTSPISREFN